MLTRRTVGTGLAPTITLVLVVGCGLMRPSGPGFSRQDAIRTATEQAKQSAPELGIQDARVDDVTPELITLAETDRRHGSQHPGGYGAGRDQRTPVWWVRVAGRFRYEGMRAPGPGSALLYEADELVFVDDARTGDPIGGCVGPARRVTPATTP